jgi:hypothetical protein
MNATHALGQFLRTLPHSAAATFLALFPIVDPFDLGDCGATGLGRRG